ncbi:MAG: hypothetical protein K2H45_11885, partial [Acetatifactor sp.]|nr:hypothetical protein [Acetatifactor sp.]
VLRRLILNDVMLRDLIDSRSAAASWLRENISLIAEKERENLAKIAYNYQTISDTVSAFRRKTSDTSTCAIAYNTIDAVGVSTPELRREQTDLLQKALALEEENCRLAERILELPEMQK